MTEESVFSERKSRVFKNCGDEDSMTLDVGEGNKEGKIDVIQLHTYKI